MELAEHIEALRTEGMMLADAADMMLVDATTVMLANGDETTGFDSQVPTCPEWTVRDLLRHVGEVHRWARSHVAEARQSVNKENFATYPEDDAGLLAWFREGHAELLAALEAADPDGDYFAFLPGPKGTRFWARRQAHETAMHRVDAQSVTGLVSPTSPDFAVDGVDEILHGFFARRPSRMTSGEPYTFALVSTDVPKAWHVSVDGEGPTTSDSEGDSDCRVYGSAFDLYLLLWNRRALDGLEVQGDTRGLEHWRDNARVRWS